MSWPGKGSIGFLALAVACSEGGGATDAGVADAGAAGDAEAVSDASSTEIAGALDGLRWELPCLADDANPSLCTATASPISSTAMLAGKEGTTYTVRLRFRGVIEPNAYSGGSGAGYWYVGGAAADPYANVYSLRVSEPEQIYYANAGTVRLSTSLYCETIDYSVDVEIGAGATVTLSANPRDGLEIKNRDTDGTPLIVEGVEPAPEAFGGQFIQMDVVSVEAP